MDTKTQITASVESHADEWIAVSKKIWDFAELGYKENQSAALLCSELASHGFTVTTGLAGIDTAFKGVWGTGSPVMGILGEYDALPGLSQEAGCPVKKPVVEGAAGHGCGHNLLGTGALAAAVALKEYLEATGKSGTVVYFGTPAEENLSGKAFMARDHAFDGVDFFLSWHPDNINSTATPHHTANVCKSYTFKGVTAHAAAAPHLGRSALDSCELMGVGVNYLREHVIMEARIHYAYLDTGGRAPNVVMDHAKVRYVVRAPYYRQVKEILPRVDDIARGAALMCGTTVTMETEAGYSEYLNNDVLAAKATEAFHAIGAPAWDENDYALAKAFTESFTSSDKNTETELIRQLYGADKLEAIEAKPLDTNIRDFDPAAHPMTYGSTDVGDVGFIAPAFFFTVATEALGTPAHSWLRTGQAASPLGQKGMLTAAKVMALTAVLMLDDPAAIKAAKKEFLAKNGGVYDCPVADVKTLPTF